MNVRWPHGDPRDVAHAILSDPRFQTAAHRAAAKPWWQQIFDAIGSALERLFAPIGRLAGNEVLTTIVGVVVMVAVMLLLLVVVARFAHRAGGFGRRARTADGAAISLDGDADARTLRARALAAAAEGRYHEAAALLWLSALRALDERGRVRYDAARTPGEWRRIVRDSSFDALARDATVALFAGDAADAALVARMTSAYDRVVVPA